MFTWILILSLLALGFILIEIFFIPGLGVTGVLGALFLLIATYLASQAYGPWVALALFMIVLTIGILSFVVFFRSSASHWIVLNQPLDKVVNQPPHLKVGNCGVITTALRPSGKAIFQIQDCKRPIDVITQGEFIERDEKVRIIQIEGNKVVVIQDKALNERSKGE